jgi:hypothetical protein
MSDSPSALHCASRAVADPHLAPAWRLRWGECSQFSRVRFARTCVVGTTKDLLPEVDVPVLPNITVDSGVVVLWSGKGSGARR